MTDQLVRAPLRLAIRTEGTWVSAYLARADTMRDAEIVGSIRKEALDADKELFESFRLLMQLTATVLIYKRTGLVPQWPDAPSPAPEHERSGSG